MNEQTFHRCYGSEGICSLIEQTSLSVCHGFEGTHGVNVCCGSLENHSVL